VHAAQRARMVRDDKFGGGVKIAAKQSVKGHGNGAGRNAARA
jgi:hypothetical protein